MAEMITMTGGKELARMFQELTVKVEQNGLTQMTRAGTVPIRKAARAKVSNHKKYARTIKTRKKKSPRGIAKFEVSSKSRLSHLLEYGVRPHRIAIKNKKVLADMYGQTYGQFMDHPGIAPQPHLRPAYDENKGTALDAMANKAREFIFKEALKR